MAIACHTKTICSLFIARPPRLNTICTENPSTSIFLRNVLVPLLYCYPISFRLIQPTIKGASLDCVTLAMICQPYATDDCLHRDACMSHHRTCSHDLFHPVQQLDGAASLPSKNGVYRELSGALVRFRPGAEVCSVDFSSDDYCEVRISCEQQACVAEQLQDYLAKLGELVPKSCITAMEGADGTCLTTYIRVKDQYYAEKLKAKLASDPLRHLFPKFKVEVKDGLLEDWSTSCFSDIRFQINSVRCYWRRPSRNALLCFDTIYQAKEAEKILRDAEIRIHGRRIHARYEAPHSLLAQPGVRIRYLDISAMYQTITNKLPVNVRPSAIKLEDPSYWTTFPHVERAMMNLLSRYGPIEDWQVTEKCNHRESRAIVRFRDYHDAQAAIRELDGYRLPEIEHSELRMRRDVSLRFRRIPGFVFDVLKKEVDKLREDLHQAGQVRMEVGCEIDYCQREFVSVQLSGKHSLFVAKAKSAVQNLLAGELAMCRDSKLWDEWFAKSNGSTFFAELSAIYEGFVRVDVKTEQIFLYGSAQVMEGMQNAILDKLAMQKGHRIILQDPEGLKRAMQGSHRRIVEATWQHRAGMYVGSSTKKITNSGIREDFNTARHLFYEPKRRIHKDNNRKPDCSVCLTPASDPIQTPCGHIYCKSCFANQCSAATSNTMIPIRCLGDSDNCSYIFTVEELETYLTHEAFEQLLETSLTQYVRTNIRSLRQCPTPDCPSTYRFTTIWAKLLCHSCLNVICPNCQAKDHDGMSCEAYQAAIKADEEFAKWKQQHNVNQCPKCDAHIEKIDGCNHIECTNCANHICWQCMASFHIGSEVYEHMQEVHGTFMPLEEGWQEEHAAFFHEFDFAIPDLPQEMVFAGPNWQMPDPEHLPNHQGHEQRPLIPAPPPPPPSPPAVTRPLPFNIAHTDDAFFEDLPPPAPPESTPPFNHAPLDTTLLETPPTQPQDRGRGDGVINWLIDMLRNNTPRAHHHHPQLPAFITNNTHVTEAEERLPESDPDSDSDSDVETASGKSHTNTPNIPTPVLNHSPSESDDDFYFEPSLLEDETSTAPEEEIETASSTESDTDLNQHRYQYRNMHAADVDPADFPLMDYGPVYERMGRQGGWVRGME